MAQLWGKHAHLSKITNQQSTVHEAKRQVDVAQAHTNYQVSMMGEELACVICLDAPTNIIHVVTGKKISSLALRFVLLNYLKMKDGHSMIAKAHQEGLQMTTYIVIPNTPKAKRMILMMNKNLPAFLWHMLQEHGLPKEFIKDLLQCSCEATMLAKMHNCQWDEKMRTLATAEEATREEEVKAFKSASWFKDEFGLLPKALGKQKNYTAPEALYNLEGAGSIKTIHDRHEKQNKPKANAATSTEKKKQKKDDAIKVLSSSESSGKLGSSSTSRDSSS